ncbi:hypothetical protein D9M68_735790 [compost metagenome]
MNKILLFASIGMLTVATSTLSLADAREHRADLGMGVLSGYDKVHMQLAWDSRKRDVHAGRDEASDNREQTKGTRPDDRFDHGMQAVPTTAGPGQPGDGWLYFSHPAGDRAVVISPKGEYYFSDGKGLRLVAVTQPRS